MEMIKKYNKNNKEKGITLVALVVTIIVLLILAFIGIALLTGEDGIIKKAKESKDETIKAQEKEYIKLAYQNLEMELQVNGKDITTYGIENTGILNYYDGTINGASAVSGTITNRPDGYVIRTTTVNSKERYYLST